MTFKTRELSVLSEEYTSRRRTQMLRFLGATTFTLISFRYFKKALISRQYRPNMFQLNNRPPPVAAQNEAMAALTIATSITISLFSMAITGSCWIYDISSVQELRYALRNTLVPSSEEASNDNMDQETSDAIEQLKLAFSKK
ncbi:hypothetical protein TPHA_0E00950 [Tetrapisispora phaffii CBS 4417]|uniref:Altered inheritance of mitochondria protein 11 n=1 Tax=Tetrapisispora phaffii (strain ATCC 24235 / CBS 4417 / NBRC 1672 / NRRL Y-8282 / UCD 70-5) TaxID=1071381 RepID=G8BTG1_TETPH|nr:hypothetical protein TPHA_0E00950 [Tetrapisispora phaffii CBS 4417]CCE63189.1 hypothetical protein TPHA_0E00950 [Tetrapisispora phaffii CBS 4417]